MFEVQGRKVTTRVGKLPGSTYPTGELLTEAQAASLEDSLNCLDAGCKAPVQLVRETTIRRAQFRHRPCTATTCSVGGPMSEWHSFVQGDLLEGAFSHEYSIPGARIDAAVQRVNSDKIVAIEVQYSPISSEMVMRHHDRHRAADVAGTVWVVPASHITQDDRVRTRWVRDLINACLDTPASAPGEPGYGCVVGFLDLEPKDEDVEPSLRFIDVIVKEQRTGGQPGRRRQALGRQ